MCRDSYTSADGRVGAASERCSRVEPSTWDIRAAGVAGAPPAGAGAAGCEAPRTDERRESRRPHWCRDTHAVEEARVGAASERAHRETSGFRQGAAPPPRNADAAARSPPRRQAPTRAEGLRPSGAPRAVRRPPRGRQPATP